LVASAVKVCRIFTRTLKYLDFADKFEKEGRLSDLMLERLMSRWAKTVLAIVGVHVEIEGKPTNHNAIYVGNHISYLDIPALIVAKPVAFVAKREVGTWPVIGRAAHRVRTVLVKRSSSDSRKAAITGIHTALANRSVVVFPSGTTTIGETKHWRYGVFQLAATERHLVQPFVIDYQPRRVAAYIDKDTLLGHMWQLVRYRGGVRAKIRFLAPLHIDQPEAQAESLWQTVREILRRSQNHE
jgi:1-acyl-sn-glycerol-3-phosphate acyltransferase